MANPHDLPCIVPKCPVCGRPAQGVYYLSRDYPGTLQFVCHHGINGQKQKWRPEGVDARNDFCWIDYVRPPKKGEIVTRSKANPMKRADWKVIKAALSRRRRQNTKK
jgi:hypothetical protein